MDARQAIRAEHGAAILYASEISESMNSNRRERQPIWLAKHSAAIFYATEISELLNSNRRESQPIWLVNRNAEGKIRIRHESQPIWLAIWYNSRQ